MYGPKEPQPSKLRSVCGRNQAAPHAGFANGNGGSHLACRAARRSAMEGHASSSNRDSSNRPQSEGVVVEDVEFHIRAVVAECLVVPSDRCKFGLKRVIGVESFRVAQSSRQEPLRTAHERFV